MTSAGPADPVEPGDGAPLTLLRLAILLFGFLALGFLGTLDLEWPQQAILGLLTIVLAVWLDRGSRSRLITLTLILFSLYSTFRYGFWRVSSTFAFLLDAAHTVSAHQPAHPTLQTALFAAAHLWPVLPVCLLLFAELYAFTVLVLGYVQSLWPLRRLPVPLPDDTDQWPAVDLLIPTFNEPLHLVQHTALAALNIDWPADKLNVYLLDDGRRDEFRIFCEQAGIGYMTRDDNRHAKAGNLNHALERLNAPLVAVFDCDHVPTRSFLQVTVGWFLRDQKLAMLQTPQSFYSPDPFERNLGQFRIVPNEEELFYGVVQDGNDLWNATLFCGSCAVLRRSALDEIGGIAVETVTEDAHTSLRLQSHGWNTAYINLPQAAGLATERLRGHIRQRVRWARGMLQILRVDNPLFARGLNLAQRLCYFNAILHFLYGVPRLIFLTAPLVYLLFGRTNIPGYWAAILAYAIPHLILSTITHSRIQGSHRHSFWNEIYETVLSPFILLPTLLAVLFPRSTPFAVTEKGTLVNRRFFDTRIAWPFLLLIVLHLAGIALAIPRLWHIHLPPFDRLYDGARPGTILLNLLWAAFNLVLLGVATAVAWEARQRRHAVRLPMAMPADVLRADGTPIEGVTVDISSGGVLIHLDHPTHISPGETIQFLFPVLSGAATLPATVVGVYGINLRAEFRALTLQERETLALVLYSRADNWLGWGQSREADHPLRSLVRILHLSTRGLSETLRRNPAAEDDLDESDDPDSDSDPDSTREDRKRNLASTGLLLLLLALSSGIASAAQDSADSPPTRPTPSTQRIPSASTTLRLGDISTPLKLRGNDAIASIAFSLPRTQSTKSATLHLRYQASPGLIAAQSHLKVSVNGSLLAALPVAPQTSTPSGLLEAVLTIPADLLTPTSKLTFEFIGHYATACEDPANSTLWLDVDPDSAIEFSGEPTPLEPDLKLLPSPFFEPSLRTHVPIEIVFLSPPSQQALEAAGILASSFGILASSTGVLADRTPIRFSVHTGSLPTGNAIVLADDPSALPANLDLTTIGPTIALRPNPADPTAQLLILSGRTRQELLTAAQSFALQPGLLRGDEVRIARLNLPPARVPDDAPRWMSTRTVTSFGDLAQAADLQRTDATPIHIDLRLPPDLYLAPHQTIPLYLNYRYNALPLGDTSTLQLFLNGAFISSTPLPHADQASANLGTVIPIAPANLRPSINTLQASFLFEPAHHTGDHTANQAGNCAASPATTRQGAIQKDSYLDLHDLPHWTALPNLALFARSGFPFTRKADLSDTAIVLPDVPTPGLIELYLTLVAHMAAETGYPALRLTVTNPAGMTSDSASNARDYLVLAPLDDPATQTALSRLDADLPVGISATGLQIHHLGGFFASWLSSFDHAWWKVPSSDPTPTGQLETSGSLPDAILEGFEWPRGSSRSVVLLAIKDPAVLPTVLAAFLDPAQSSTIAESTSIFDGTAFKSYRIAADQYHVGSLPPLVRLRLLFAEFPALLVVALAFVCLVMAFTLRALLRREAHRRLNGQD